MESPQLGVSTLGADWELELAGMWEGLMVA